MARYPSDLPLNSRGELLLWLDVLEDEWLSLFSRPYYFASLFGDRAYLRAMDELTRDLAERRAFNAANPDHISAKPREIDAPPTVAIEDLPTEALSALAGHGG